MKVLDSLKARWEDQKHPFMIDETKSCYFSEIFNKDFSNLSVIHNGAVVALIGDFDPNSISIILQLIEKNAIIVPLTIDTIEQHEYFFDAAGVEFVIQGENCRRLGVQKSHPLILKLRAEKKPGLILFSSGTTGKPKAILHDFSKFLSRYEEKRPTLKILNFLLFDHIGGINTLLHSLYNKGTLYTCKSRTVEDILELCRRHQVEVLPTTPTFMRMMLLSGQIPSAFPESLKVITYGTERLDKGTLDALCELLPNIDFRQTYGMSELGILRVKSKARNSLFMKIGGSGVETKVENNVLFIRSKNAMLGYLNADTPFDENGWYCTKDQIIQDDEFIQIVGRDSEVINVGGLKFMASDVETQILRSTEINFANVYARHNPITGQHVEAKIQPVDPKNFDLSKFKAEMRRLLPKHMMPRKFYIQDAVISHRFKKL